MKKCYYLVILLTSCLFLYNIHINYYKNITKYNYAIGEDKFVFIKQPPKTIKKVNKHKVIATVYYPTKKCCDKTPNITASGFKFDVTKAKSYKICAVSRDLLYKNGGPYKWGDKIFVNSNNEYKGIWIVHDTMNKRFTNRIDLLVNKNDALHKFETTIWKL